jgi:ribose transport system permease protein
MSEPGPARDATTPTATTSDRRDLMLALLERYALVIVFVAVLVFFSVWGRTSSTFPTAANVKNVLGNQAVIGVLSLAIMFPLVCGEFDFSVGPVAGLSQVLTAGFMARLGMPLALAVLLGIAVGAVVGIVSGLTVGRIGVSSVIVTLGISAALTGIVAWYTSSQSIITGISSDLTDLGSGEWLGVPRTLIVLAFVALIVYYVLEHTPFGRCLYSIGSNPAAARLVGLPVERLVITAFLLSGTLAGLAGVLLVARNGSASPQVGTVGDSLQALAAAYLGATAIRPGRFNVAGTLIAIFFLAFTVTGLSLAGVSSWINDLVNGLALFVAVLISTVVGRRVRAAGPSR